MFLPVLLQLLWEAEGRMAERASRANHSGIPGRSCCCCPATAGLPETRCPATSNLQTAASPNEGWQTHKHSTCTPSYPLREESPFFPLPFKVWPVSLLLQVLRLFPAKALLVGGLGSDCRFNFQSVKRVVYLLFNVAIVFAWCWYFWCLRLQKEAFFFFP